MRISDWSSDVCSSDLWCFLSLLPGHRDSGGCARLTCGVVLGIDGDPRLGELDAVLLECLLDAGKSLAPENELLAGRSEEHTSELQSLMRISYAVFCLKKKTYKYNAPLITQRVSRYRSQVH